MSTVKLQIPIDKETRDALAVKAKSLGFDSIQAYFRVWAKAEVDGRRIQLDAPWQFSDAAAEKYNSMAKDEDNFSPAFNNIDDFMKDLDSEADKKA